MILLYGMPALVAQGILFVGFIYVMAYVIQGIESLVKKNKKQHHYSNITIDKSSSSLKSTEQVKTTPSSKKPKYKVLLTIISDVAKIEQQSKYVFLGITSITIEDKEVSLKEIDNKNDGSTINGFGDIEDNIMSYWVLEVEDLSFDISKLKFICIFKDEECSALSIYSASEIVYDNKYYKLKRIEDLRHLDGYKSAISFDNWINGKGLNNKLSLSEAATRKVMDK